MVKGTKHSLYILIILVPLSIATYMSLIFNISNYVFSKIKYLSLKCKCSIPPPSLGCKDKQISKSSFLQLYFAPILKSWFFILILLMRCVWIFMTETISRTDEGQPRRKYLFDKCGTNTAPTLLTLWGLVQHQQTFFNYF